LEEQRKLYSETITAQKIENKWTEMEINIDRKKNRKETKKENVGM
jgi:hypothetical protein